MAVWIIIDNRLRIKLSKLDEDLLRDLKEATTHKNPEFLKKKSMGYSTWNTPPQLKTWRVEGEYFTLPRGAMSRVREIFKKAKIRIKVRDKRISGAPIKVRLQYQGLPLRPYQFAGATRALCKEQGIVRAATGCLSGDARIYIRRGSIEGEVEFAHIAYMFRENEKEAKRKKTEGWDWKVPTEVRFVSEKQVKYGTIQSVYLIGKQTTFLLSTATRAIRATLDHRFLVKRTKDDKWKRLVDLRVGDELYVTNPLTQLVSTEVIISIGTPKHEMTYDLTIKEKEHNYIANEFVVHNSGKTTTAFALAASIGLNVLVILPNAKLMKQWISKAKKDLGLNPRSVGVIRGTKKKLFPLTVATQQTLCRRLKDKEIHNFFGAIIVDEVQRTAAQTSQSVVDNFPAKYRIGFSADERRKDRKECLVYDAFGDIVHETDRETSEKYKAIVDVEVRLVFTEFEAPWYRNQEKPDFNYLLDEMIVDQDRNRIITKIALSHLRAKDRIILLTHRREHARALDLKLVKKGFRSGVMLGGDDAGDVKEFEKARIGLITGKIRAGIGTYEAIGEGIDLPEVTVGIATTPIATNEQRFNQVRGRLCRPADDKEKGILYVLIDRFVFPKRVIYNVLAWNRTVKAQINGQWVDAKKHRSAIMSLC